MKGWTYWDYVNAPSDFIDHILIKMEVEAKHQAAQRRAAELNQK